MASVVTGSVASEPGDTCDCASSAAVRARALDETVRVELKVAVSVRLLPKLSDSSSGSASAVARVDYIVEHLTSRSCDSESSPAAVSPARSGTSSPKRSVTPLRLSCSPPFSPEVTSEFSVAEFGVVGRGGIGAADLVSHMASIPEDLTQREPAPLTPAHMRARTPTQHGDGEGGEGNATVVGHHPRVALPSLSEDDDQVDVGNEDVEDDSMAASGRSLSALSDLSALSNASTGTSIGSELWLARSLTDEDALRAARARQTAAARQLGQSISPPHERFDPAQGVPTVGPGASAAAGLCGPHVRFPTPRPTESLASRMAQQRRQRMAQRAQHRHRDRRREGDELAPSDAPGTALLAAGGWLGSSGGGEGEDIPALMDIEEEGGEAPAESPEAGGGRGTGEIATSAPASAASFAPSYAPSDAPAVAAEVVDQGQGGGG
jgi:hypothetical protein